MISSKPAFGFALALLTQASNIAHFILRDAAADQGPVHRTFRSETAKRRRQLAGMYVLYVCSKRSLRSPHAEHTSEHVKSKNFLGAYPQPPSHNLSYGPYFLYLPRAPTILSAALWGCVQFSIALSWIRPLFVVY